MTSNKKFAAIGITLTALAFGLAGCAGTTKTTKNSDPESGFAPGLSGKIVETMDAGGYTYVAIEKDGKKSWAAIPTTKVTVGQDIKLLPGADMPGFSSKTLNRSFDHLIFSGGVDTGVTGKAPAAPKKQMAPAAPVLSGKVVETMNATSYTYILLEKDGKQGWTAIPTADVKVGEELEVYPGVEMGSFKSSTLNRTFDGINFTSGIKSRSGKAPAAADAKAEAKTAETPLPPGHPKLDAAPAAPAVDAAAGAELTGKVVETTDAGGYTYVCLEKDKVKTWAAIPATKVKVGDELTLPPGNVMRNFSSKSLNRTFEKIIFTNGPVK